MSSWSYDSWIYNYLCNKCLSSLTLLVRIPLRRGILDTTLCDKVCQWLASSRVFSPGTPFYSTNKTDRHDITEILLKVALTTITLTLTLSTFLTHEVGVLWPLFISIATCAYQSVCIFNHTWNSFNTNMRRQRNLPRLV